MTRRVLVAVAAAAAALAACEPLDPMARRQQKVRAYDPSPFFADGLAMRQPPAGTVPVERVLDPAVLTGAGPDGAPVARIPVPVTPELLALGRKRFEIVCAACHGILGDGDSMVAKNMSLRPPPSLFQRKGEPDGYFFQVMSRGFGLMPSYAAELPVSERWAVVAYVRALQLSQHARLDQAPADVRARLEKEKTP